MFRNTFWSVYGYIDETRAQQRRAHVASVRARVRQRKRIEELEDDLARIGLLTLALARLCVDKGVLSADELKACVREIDLSDGVEDGKAPPDATA